jgi:hypothetical protein
MTIRRLCTACWIPQATNTRSEYVIVIAFPRQQWLSERASILLCMYIASLAFSPFLFLLFFLSLFVILTIIQPLSSVGFSDADSSDGAYCVFPRLPSSRGVKPRILLNIIHCMGGIRCLKPHVPYIRT